MKKVFAGFAALAVLLTSTATAAYADDGNVFTYDINATTITAPVNVVVPANVTAFLNPYDTTVVFDRSTLEPDANAVGEDRLELKGDIVSPVYTIENIGEAPISVYVSVSGDPLGSAVLTDADDNGGKWDPLDKTRGVALWITGGLDKSAVQTDEYDVSQSIAISETENTRTMIEQIDASGKGYFKINGSLNKNFKGWEESDGVHINMALKVVPAEV